jgi:hypothetical protein
LPSVTGPSGRRLWLAWKFCTRCSVRAEAPSNLASPSGSLLESKLANHFLFLQASFALLSSPPSCRSRPASSSSGVSSTRSPTSPSCPSTPPCLSPGP